MNEASTAQWEIQQLIKSRLFPDEQAVLRSALRALYQLQPEIKQQMVIRAYTAGEISLGKAAEIMGVSHEEMKDILVERGAEIHLGPRTVDELLRDAANA
jgi:predicted HTH domain antitoxin